MARYSNRTMKRASCLLAHLIDMEADHPRVTPEIERIGALMGRVDEEMERHKAERESLLSELRDACAKYPEELMHP